MGEWQLLRVAQAKIGGEQQYTAGQAAGDAVAESQPLDDSVVAQCWWVEEAGEWRTGELVGPWVMRGGGGAGEGGWGGATGGGGKQEKRY